MKSWKDGIWVWLIIWIALAALMYAAYRHNH